MKAFIKNLSNKSQKLITQLYHEMGEEAELTFHKYVRQVEVSPEAEKKRMDRIHEIMVEQKQGKWKISDAVRAISKL